MNITDLKDKIVYYRTRLWLIIGLISALVIGQFLMYWQWYFKIGKEIVLKPASFNLERKEFDRLWKNLTEKTVEVELNQEIRYGEDIGKLEPFE